MQFITILKTTDGQIQSLVAWLCVHLISLASDYVRVGGSIRKIWLTIRSATSTHTAAVQWGRRQMVALRTAFLRPSRNGINRWRLTVVAAAALGINCVGSWWFSRQSSITQCENLCISWTGMDGRTDKRPESWSCRLSTWCVGRHIA